MTIFLRQNFCLVIFFSFMVLVTVYVKEKFSHGDKCQERWVLSERWLLSPNETMGFFILMAGKYYGHPEKSKGEAFQHHGYGITVKLPHFRNKNKTLVIQFTVKNKQVTKTHVIFYYKGKYLDPKKQIRHVQDPFTHLYTLIIYPDNTYVVKIDNKDEARWNLKDDWDFLPPEYIKDYTAEKPKDWDDRTGPKIKNPECPELCKFDEICPMGLSIEVFKGQAGSNLDNFLITDDPDYAEKQSWETWRSLRDAEKEMRRKINEEERHNEL